MIDSNRVIEAFQEQWYGPVPDPILCLASAFREVSEAFYAECLVEMGGEFERVSDEIELNATKQ